MLDILQQLNTRLRTCLIYISRVQNKFEMNQQNKEQNNFQKDHIINGFVIGKQIGVGTFSKVKIAKHQLTNEQVVFKIIEKNKIINQADQNRLSREVKILRKVRHPNIIQLYQIIETKKYIYLVTEYAVRGQLFQHIVSQEKLTQFQASKILHQLIDAIQYIHQLGIAHRDLKPQNLLLDNKFNIKLADFGLSNIYVKNSKLKTACGSPCYASPQMIRGQEYDGLKSDIWSLGIILFAMCFGFLPFDHENTAQLYNSIKNGCFEIPQIASDSLKDILKIILEKQPHKRASIESIRNHNFCKIHLNNSIPGIILGLSEIPFQVDIQKQIKELGINTNELQEAINKNKHNNLSCCYYLLLQRYLRSKNKTVVNYYFDKIHLINRYKYIQKIKENVQNKFKFKAQIKIMKKQKKESKIKRVSATETKYINKTHQKKQALTEEKINKSKIPLLKGKKLKL